MKEKLNVERYVFILGQSFPRSELVKLGLIAGFVVLMLTVGGVFFYLDWRGARLARVEKLAESEPLDTPLYKAVGVEASARDPLVAFFDEFIGMTRFDEVDSIRAVGLYTVNGVEMELTFLAKRPRLYRQTLEKGSAVIEFGYDGDDVWFEQSHAVVDDEDSALMNLNRYLAIFESAIPTLSWDYDVETVDQTFELMPDTVWAGKLCHVVKNKGLIDGSPVYHYIDKKTGFEHYRRASLQIAPRRYKDVELFYDDPLADAKYPIPSGMELLLDGRLYYKVVFEQVEINQGIPSFLFQQN